MEPGTRKILPRIRPSSAGKRDLELVIESAKRPDEAGGGVGVVNGTGGDGRQYNINLKQWRPAYDEDGPKRKRQNVADSRAPSHSQSHSQSQSQVLPGVQHLLTVPTDPNALESQMTSPCRLVRNAQNGLYYNHGAFIFQAPSPGRDFPPRLSHDTRELSFAMLEPELMDIFKHTWYLRQYVRQRRSQGMEIWWDHIMLNDCYGIENVLHTWSSRYEPGSVYYPASMLYKHVLWIYFNRSIQPSMATTGFRAVVDDGLHYLQALEKLLGNVDRSFLLVPIFLLGTTAFEPRQRGNVFRSLERVDPTHQTGVFNHAMHALDLIWGMMDDGRAGTTWDWERLQAPDSIQNVMDPSLVDLLRDPFMPEYRPSRVRSPEAMPEFDNSRFRAAPMPNPAPVPPVPEAALNTRTSSGDTGQQSPPQGISPTDNSRSATVPEGSDQAYAELKQERTLSQPELAPAQPRPFLAPPPPSSSMHSNSELLQALTRKVVKTKSTVPPCPTCGKELKNPSDAQKHHLQHSKPFLCREPGCTRIQGFATENDLQRHRKSVHGASPRIGNKIGYVCVQCPEPSDGTQRKWWPRLDNFKAHIRRKHNGADEEALIQASATPRRPEDTFTDSGYYPGSDYMPGSQYLTSASTTSSSDQHAHHYHHPSIASQLSDVMEGQTQEESQMSRYEEDEMDDEGEGDGEDDGPVGPWELSRSFRGNANGKRPSEGDEEDEEGDEEERMAEAEGESEAIESERSGSGSKGDEDESTPKAVPVDEAQKEKIEQESVDEPAAEAKDGSKDEDAMEVDTVDGSKEK